MEERVAALEQQIVQLAESIPELHRALGTLLEVAKGFEAGREADRARQREIERVTELVTEAMSEMRRKMSGEAA